MLAGGTVLFLLALYFAVILTTPRVKGKRLLRTVLFFPYSINVVGIAFLWLFVLEPQIGALNGALEALGLGDLTQVWFGSRGIALGSIIWIIIWTVIGFYTILLQAGIDNIPQELFDAARVDGAHGLTLFRRITLPLLRDVLAVAVTYWMIQALKIFGIIYATTRGAPASETHTVATYMFEIAMPYQEAVYRFGYGTAIAVLQFVLIVVISVVFFRLVRRREAVEF
jgi:ABC-type sugar transport system permease subunit